MTTSSNPDFEQPDIKAPENNEELQQPAAQNDLLSDPEFNQLLELYQKAEFDACKELLDKLQERYPEDPVLSKFQDELEIKLSVKAMTASMEAGEQRVKRKATLKLSAFAIVGTLVVLIAFFLSLMLFLRDVEVPEPLPSQGDTAQLESLYQQAEQLLTVGQPRPAAEIIEKIRAIDPEYPSLADLTARKEVLLAFDAQYQSALALIEEGNTEAALEILRAIEDEKPGLWDINKQIAAIELEQIVDELVEEGTQAFRANDWPKVIEIYEEVYRIDPRIDRPQVKDQLLYGYLNQIINLLEDEDTSLQEIQVAEGYYLKALALIPQDRAYITERGNLQELSQDLLFLKFTQIARENLADKNQRIASINQAVRFLQKAVDLKPENTAAARELSTAQLYRTGFQNFINKNWMDAIVSLEQVINSDPNFANGNATILLSEAYYALAKQYYAASVYPDALGYLEKAEFLVWGIGNNLANLFEIQVLIGDILGQIGQYENAVSYYQYALNATQVPQNADEFPVIATRLATAENALARDDYESAFRTFRDMLSNIDVIYSVQEIEVGRGVCLALFANANGSTLELVLKANDLPNEMIIPRSRVLKVPVINR